MDPISNVDKIAILLREKLRERTRAYEPGQSQPTKESAKERADGLASARAIATLNGLDDRLKRRALVQQVLTEQFGEDLLNDAQFQQVVERVSSAIDADETANAMLGELIGKLHR